MTRAVPVFVLAALGCGGDSKAPPKVDIPADHAAAVNALVPADLKDKVVFEVAAYPEHDFNKGTTYRAALPKGWKVTHMGELEPADADNFGSPTLGRTRFGIGSNCDGECKKKDWAATSDKVDFAQFTGGKIDGKVLKDEKTEHGRLLVFEHARGGPFADKDVAIRIVRAWWTGDSAKYFTCRAELGAPAKELAAAFEKACSIVSGG